MHDTVLVRNENDVLDADFLIERLSDVLNMPDETLALAYTYISRFQEAVPKLSSEDPSLYLDNHTLALTCLHLADKLTYGLSKLSHILVAAWHLLHPDDPFLCPPWLASECASPLRNGSLFISLRNAIDAAETVVLRVLAFKLSYSTPVLHYEECLKRGLTIAQRGIMLNHVCQEHHLEDPKSRNKRKHSSGASDKDLSRKKPKQEIFQMPHPAELAELQREPIIGQAKEFTDYVRKLSLEACKISDLSSTPASVLATAAVYVALGEDLALPMRGSRGRALPSWAGMVADSPLSESEFIQFIRAVLYMEPIDAKLDRMAQELAEQASECDSVCLSEG
ncbi:hypothetical protein IWZ00DRAFT_42389 [Phyllosticta capitalensis]|uniref:uncharacterized protein n=1 Tax=Phyllosticta capitalensis TaxID=121624 RepID=UPI00312E18B4